MEFFEEREKYLTDIKAQIRWKRAKDVVSEELEQHIEDQKQAFLEKGMSEEESERAAVREMGDPVETGMRLDRVHRPKMAWGMFVWIFLLFAVGLIAMSTITGMSWEYTPDVYIKKQVSYMGIGLIFLFCMYFADYTVLGKYPVAIFLTLTAGLLLMLLGGISPQINGVKISMIPWMFLFLPAYAGIIYRYRNQGYAGIIKCILLSALPMLIALRIPSSLAFLELLLSALLLLSLMAGKGWFGENRKKMLLAVWIPILFLGTGIAGLFGMGGSFYSGRLQALLHPERYADSFGYTIMMIRGFLSNLKPVGASSYPGTDWEVEACLGPVTSDRMLLYIFVHFGWIAGAAVTVCILGFLVYLFWLAQKQKSILGYLTGNACALVFALQCIFYIQSNLGILNFAAGFLPFMSFGGRAMITNMSIAGLLLSVYRNTSIVKNERTDGRSRKRFVTWEDKKLTFYF